MVDAFADWCRRWKSHRVTCFTAIAFTAAFRNNGAGVEMTVASLYWARVLAAWSRAQAFLRRLRREKPQFYRFGLEVPVGIALSALFSLT